MAPVAVISGGLGDIGRAIALELSGIGAAVALGDLADSDGGFCKTLARGRYDRVDTTDAAAIDAWLDAVTDAFGTPTWIVPNAAQVTVVGALDVTPEQWRREIDVNLTGAFLLAQAGARRLLASGSPGAVVVTGSWAGHAVHPALPAYSVAKAGLRMAVRCLALELAPHGIRVNEVAPGYVDAGLSRQIFDRTPGLRESARAKVPTRSLIEPKDVAALVAFLLSDAARHITGETLTADGGLSLRSPAGGD